MPSERRQKIETVFHTATSLAETERGEYLDKIAGEDREMHREVGELLQRFDAENAAAVQELDAMKGRLTGAYRLIREIGRLSAASYLSISLAIRRHRSRNNSF